ncbi:translocation and assembly module TamB [Bosea sp. CRIB-10]|uniref:translocation/assembly module TamB domain-containing protein n=1 Tax=Bosea sp. CRIB-10 TaxID=378404 RepID=UPI0008E7C6A9|nr:translocation/assembly module TamB domain-containing protein [Bosea sp. CRIB-10]SFC90717.1 translocation and assembly module TamB [Bosea sp. CRIB-10]
MGALRISRWLAGLAALVIAAALVLVTGLGGFAQNAGERGVLADLISKALSTDGSQVSIGAVDGALSSDASIRDIVISDRDGPWLRLDRARLIWTRSALLLRRLEVNRLEIGKLEILRKPLPDPAAPPPADNSPILPELPLKVIVETFQLGELALGPTVIGAPARLSATGAARLGPPNEGLDFRLAGRRLDMGGMLDVTLRFVPQTTQLQLAVKLDEPAGGLISTIADLPDRPPVKLDLTGDGPLDRFRATLAFTAGPTIGANGTADLSRQGAGRRLLLALDSRIAGLMPPPVAPVFEGSTRLDGTVGLADSGAVSVDQMALVSALAQLDVNGVYSADKNLDFKITAAARPNAEGRTVTSGAEIAKLAFDATIRGPAAGPRVNASLQVEGASVPAGKLAKLDFSFTATPTGALNDPATRTVLVSDGEASGVALAEPGLARFIGDRLRFTLRGTASEGGGMFETLKLAFGGAELGYAGQLGPARILGKVEARLPDLSRLSTLAGRPLKGSATVAANVDAEPKKRLYAVKLDGGAESLTLGQEALDRLLAGKLSLGGEIRVPGSGGLVVNGLRIAGTHVAATADGALGAQGSSLKANIAIPDLRRADPKLSGQGAFDATLTGPLDKLDATLKAGITNATALGRPVPRLALDASLRDLQGALSGDATLSGEVDGRPASGALRFAKRDPGGWALPQLDIAIGSVTLNGALDLDASNLAEGNLKLAARNLDDLSALALAKLGGRIEADVTLARPTGGQNLNLKASAQKLVAPSLSLDRLDADVAIVDALRKPLINGNVQVDRAVIAGEPVSAIRLVSKGAADVSDISLDATARGFSLASKGRLSVADPLRFDLASFTATRDGRRIALAKPASFTAIDGGVAIRDLAIALDGGRITLDGEAGKALDLRFAAQNVPLSAVRLASPTLDLSGTLDAEATIKGTPEAPTGPWRLRIARLVAPQTRSAGLPPIEITGQGALDGRHTSLDASLNAGRFVSLTAKGRAPLGGDGALDLSIQGKADAQLANAQLAADGRRLTGQLALDLRAGGTLAAPRLSGGATLSGGSFSDALQGVKLTGIEARVAANGPELVIERFAAQTPGNGTLSARGNVKLDPQAGFPGTIRIEGKRAQLVDSGLVRVVTDLNLDLAGPLAQRPRIAGRVNVVTIEVSVPDRLPSSSRPVDGIRHVNAKGQAAARLAAERRARAVANRKGARAPAFDAVLDITVSAPGRVFIRGRGIDAELGGDLRVGGTSAAPALSGGFELRRGRLNLASQRLDFSKGRITFSGGVIPTLDFVAETRAADVTARIIVSGEASAPEFTFTSSPELPPDEVLSRLLFARASGSLSPFQALQLAQTAAQFSGAGGDDVFERIRRSLGVDNLDVQMGPGGPTVGVSRAVSDNITLGVKAGAKPEDSGVSVGIDVTRRLKLQAETNADGSAAVGVGAEWEY